MSSCFALAVQYGDPIHKLAEESGARGVYANNPPFLLTLVGGGVANIAACIARNLRNRSGGDYIDSTTPLATNYIIFFTIAGVIAYIEFFFYGMGDYSFSVGRFTWHSSSR